MGVTTTGRLALFDKLSSVPAFSTKLASRKRPEKFTRARLEDVRAYRIGELTVLRGSPHPQKESDPAYRAPEKIGGNFGGNSKTAAYIYAAITLRYKASSVDAAPPELFCPYHIRTKKGGTLGSKGSAFLFCTGKLFQICFALN